MPVIKKPAPSIESAGCFYLNKRILKRVKIAGPPCLRMIFLAAVKAP